jgi:hypothetical protein
MTLTDKPLRLLPLVTIDGQLTIQYDTLEWVHDQLLHLYGDQTFLDGTIDTVEDWIRMATSRHTCFFLLYHGDTPSLVLWVNDHKPSHAHLHWFWLKSPLRWSQKVSASRWALSEIFNIVPYPVLLGLSPANNTRSIDFMRAVGARIVGDIPDALYSSALGRPVDAKVIYLHRKDVVADENL